MTNNRGYIYVLANSAMPDLVKVGKTTRTPAERAAELSKSHRRANAVYRGL